MDGESPRRVVALGSRWRRSVLVAAHLLAGAWVLAAVLLVFWTRAPALLGLHTRVVTSGSMQPGLHAGDLAVLAPVTMPPTVGDIVQVSDPGVPSGCYLHRVVSLGQGGRVVTRGDANPVEDPAVPPAAVDGRLVMSVPALGTPLRWAATGRYPELALAACLASAGSMVLVRPRARRSPR
jgi:signal peptidase I